MEFAGVTKKKLCGIFRDLGFCSWNFQGRCNTVLHNFQRWSFDFSWIFRGKFPEELKWKIPGEFSKKYVSTPRGFFLEYLIVFEVWKVLLIIICKMQPLDLFFLLFYVRFYTCRYYFSLIFRTSYNIWKKGFCHESFFLMDSLKSPSP